MVQQIWSKLNARERQAAMGAGFIVLSWLLEIVLSSGLYGIAGAGGRVDRGPLPTKTSRVIRLETPRTSSSPRQWPSSRPPRGSH
jgi:hypothetical protein